MLSTVSAENKECILSGDINCNYLVSSDHNEIKTILTSFGLKQLITSPTRISFESKTLIDVICSNEPHNIYSFKVIPAGLSDHEHILDVLVSWTMLSSICESLLAKIFLPTTLSYFAKS